MSMKRNDVTRIDLGFVSAYLLGAERGFVLVDTGMKSQRERLAAALAKAGCGSGDLVLVIVSHADYDHAGNCEWLRESFGAPIAIHSADAPTLISGESPQRVMSGRFGKILTRILSKRRGGGPSCKPDILLEDGQDLAPWGLSAKVLHLPGHTPGAIGLLVEGGNFVAGDVFANWRRPAASPFVHDRAAYRASIERARKLIPIDTKIWPGHGGPFPASALEDIALGD